MLKKAIVQKNMSQIQKTIPAQNMISLLSRSKMNAPVVNMEKVASIILGGGEGTRLYPLTLSSCKPAVNFGGKYRLIDVPISNSIHANCSKIFILTQFLSSSLHRHIIKTYLQNGKNGDKIEVLTAEQKPTGKSWYMGTADAVRQNIEYLKESSAEYFLILSGDQLYNIDFEEMLKCGISEDADLVIATLPVNEQDATRMGIMTIDSSYNIVHFHEKPQDKVVLNKLKTNEHLLNRLGFENSTVKCYLGSMGIYLFKRKALFDLLQNDLREDFGKHLIPTQIKRGKTKSYIYKGYWEDIGTIDTFHKANLALTESNPQFQFHHDSHFIFSHLYDLPPAQFHNTQLDHTIACEGSIIVDSEIKDCLLGPRTVIQQGSILRKTYVMGNDYYEKNDIDSLMDSCKPQIGESCIIQNAIIDKNVCIGNNVKLVNQQRQNFYNGENIFIRDGVIVVPRGARIPDGFIL